LKRGLFGGGESSQTVETLRKPSTGLKRPRYSARPLGSLVETLRKPSTGLKPAVDRAGSVLIDSRDTQKTQHGIETRRQLFCTV